MRPGYRYVRPSPVRTGADVLTGILISDDIWPQSGGIYLYPVLPTALIIFDRYRAWRGFLC